MNRLLFLPVVLLISFAAAAQKISIPSDNGIELRCTALQKDGKAVYAGGTVKTGDRKVLFVNRYLSNGKADTSFSMKGHYQYEAETPNNYADQLELLPDGGLLILGETYDFKEYAAKFYIICLTKKGIPDNSFAENGVLLLGGLNEWLVKPVMKISSDGNILVIGQQHYTKKTNTLMMRRFLKNGKPDNSFGNAGQVTHTIEGLSSNESVSFSDANTDSTGRILILCNRSFTATGKYEVTKRDLFMCRYLPNGKTDPAFGNGNGYVHHPSGGIPSAERIVILPSKKILALSRGYMPGKDEGRFLEISRYNDDGSKDGSFGKNGSSTGICVNKEAMSYFDLAVTKKGVILLPLIVTKPVQLINDKKKYFRKLMLLSLDPEGKDDGTVNTLKIAFTADTFESSSLPGVVFLTENDLALYYTDPAEMNGYVSYVKRDKLPRPDSTDAAYTVETNAMAKTIIISDKNAAPGNTTAATPGGGRVYTKAEEEKRFKKFTADFLVRIKQLKKAFDAFDSHQMDASKHVSIEFLDYGKKLALEAKAYDDFRKSYPNPAFNLDPGMKDYAKWSLFIKRENELMGFLNVLLVNISKSINYIDSFVSQNGRMPAGVGNYMEMADYNFNKKITSFLDMFQSL